jgi:hypothetical protein
MGVKRNGYRIFGGEKLMKQTEWKTNKLKVMKVVNVQIQALLNPTLGRG